MEQHGSRIVAAAASSVERQRRRYQVRRMRDLWRVRQSFGITVAAGAAIVAAPPIVSRGMSCLWQQYSGQLMLIDELTENRPAQKEEPSH